MEKKRDELFNQIKPMVHQALSVFLCLDHHDAVEDEVKVRYKFTLLNYAGEAIVQVQSLQIFSSSKDRVGYYFFEMEELKSTSSPLLLEDSIPGQVLCHRRQGVHRDATAGAAPAPRRPPGEPGGGGYDIPGRRRAARRAQVRAGRPVHGLHGRAVCPGEENAAATHHQIDGIEPRVFKAFLHFIYTDSLPEVNEGDKVAMAQGLLVAADRYGMEKLEVICGDILCIYIDTRTAVTTLELAVKHGCHSVRNLLPELQLDYPVGLEGMVGWTCRGPRCWRRAIQKGQQSKGLAID
ncbi:hypothetical protein BAE44_0012425 [Dichanthelium oligosanthes]|uniref:BTB domain-containing protein n=1 Tax=Dichanthelium oligosanthes TaxID=888268 RepID=A0A1E5VN57_9POAL|nr:hypothetical protein BAE44_0012425 [Dichanthelium oligosanthes]